MSATPFCLSRNIDRALYHSAVLALVTALLWTVASVNSVRAQEVNSIEPRTETAIVASDKARSHAEEFGDIAYIDALLLPEYRSVNVDGSIHDKAAILGSAKKHIGATTAPAANDAWRAAHPSLTSVEINGDTAILTFTLNKPDAPKRVMSCDIFVYREGHWHALYSQHTAAEA
jgi:hypothetical protein